MVATDWERGCWEGAEEEEEETSAAAEAAAAAESLSLPSLLFSSESSISLTEETKSAAVELWFSRVEAEAKNEEWEAPAEPFLEERPEADADPAAEAEAAEEEEGLPEPSPKSAVPPLASRMSEAWESREGTSGTGTEETVRGIEDEEEEEEV